MERATLHPDETQAETVVSSDEKRLLSSQPPSTAAEASRISPKQINLGLLINKLNALNFLDSHLYVNFRHKQYRRVVTVKAIPKPCQNSHLTCLWQQDASNIVNYPELYCFQNILIPDGKHFLVAEPEVVEIGNQQIRLLLPETCKIGDARTVKRHQSHHINAYVTQNGALFYGSMIDFSAFSFRVRLKTTPPQTFGWINPEIPVTIILFNGDQTLYSGECRIIKQNHGHRNQEWVLAPSNRQIKRFRTKEFRSKRQKMVPLPTVSFTHPLSNRRVHLEVIDLSGTGLAVREEREYAVLLPGLILPNFKICFSDGARVTCTAQVVYSQLIEDEEETGMLRCGIAILDMDADEHVKILSLIQQTGNKNAYLCNRVNMDDLWNFFFETGFIYPQKYEFIEKNKSLIKDTYRKLYTQSPSIARHFIHQRNGLILAHMAIIRFYRKSWLMHHLAAIRSSTNRGGLSVFKQIGSFINDSHRLNSINMSYAFCYYRPENKFPNHVFGGAAKNIQNPKKCSIDQFAYSHFKNDRHSDRKLPACWELEPVTENHLRDLECYYEETRGGLMTQALDLGVDDREISGTVVAYAELGLVRARHLYALKMQEKLKAVIMIDVADIGLNMSDLTNSVKFIVLDKQGLSYPIIRSSLLNLFDKFQIDEMPVLIHPAESADDLGAPSEKIYNLWIFDLNYTDDYFRYLKRLFKFLKQ